MTIARSACDVGAAAGSSRGTSDPVIAGCGARTGKSPLAVRASLSRLGVAAPSAGIEVPVRTLSWIRVDVGVGQHPKTERLGDILGVERAHHLVIDLWLAVAITRPDGDLADVDDAWIARRAGWRGDAAAFTAALLAAGWLTTERRLHAWNDMQGAGAVAAAKAERDASSRSARRASKVTAPTAVSDRADRGRQNGSAVVTAENAASTADDHASDRPTYGQTDVRTDERTNGDRSIADPHTRPEPLGTWGEVIPKTAPDVLAYAFGGQTLRERWRKSFPTATDEAIERGVAAALAYRLSLDGARFARWYWPEGFVYAADDWLKRAVKADLDLAASEARARNAQAQGGGHVTQPRQQTQAERTAEHEKRIAEHQARKARGEA